MDASPEQQAVISHGTEPARLLAGPGTGKSYTLSKRVAALVSEGHDPARMLLISFTRLAATELAKGIANEDLGDREPPETSTLHGYAFRQLRLHSGEAYVGRYVVDGWELKKLIRVDLGRRVGLNPGRVSELLEAYDAAWRTLGTAPSFPQRQSFETAIEDLRRVLQFALQGELVEMFRRMLAGTPEFDPDIDFLIVDEYQDLNRCDQEVIRKLQSQGAALLIAGDDDQSLYGFRHANPDGIVGFPAEFDPCGDYTLSECRRCPREVLEPALRLIEHNPGRATKTLYSARSGGEVHVYSFDGQRRQARGVAEIVRRERDAGTRLDDIFILLPRKGFASLYLEELDQLGIAAIDLANASKFLEDDAVRRLIYLLRFAIDRDDPIAVRAWLHLTEGLGPTRVGRVLDYAIANNQPFAGAIARAGVAQVTTAFEVLTGYADQLDPEAPPATVVSDAAALLDLPEELRTRFLTVVETLSDEDSSLKSVVGRLHEYREQPEISDDGGAVKLMSLFGAKGLSADAVVIPDVEDELIPGSADVVEQRRLMYVSMTRARHRLYLCHSRYRSGATGYAGTGAQSQRLERRRSRFLDEAGLRSTAFPAT